MAKYIVRLTAEKRTQLTELISTGRRAASVLTRARMLLKADASEGGPHWSDQESAEAVETSLSSIHRVRQACVEAGLAAVLARQRPTGRQSAVAACRAIAGRRSCHQTACPQFHEAVGLDDLAVDITAKVRGRGGGGDDGEDSEGGRGELHFENIGLVGC